VIAIRARLELDGRYVKITEAGWQWVRRPADATVFPTMLDAHRFAYRHLSRPQRRNYHAEKL